MEWIRPGTIGSKSGNGNRALHRKYLRQPLLAELLNK